MRSFARYHVASPATRDVDLKISLADDDLSSDQSVTNTVNQWLILGRTDFITSQQFSDVSVVAYLMRVNTVFCMTNLYANKIYACDERHAMILVSWIETFIFIRGVIIQMKPMK